MAQQLIDVGTIANDRTGDTWRDAFIKVNANETELFADIAAIGMNFIAQESDFDVQDATTITLETGQLYVITASLTTSKRFICENSGAITALNQFVILTYTGSGSMFTGVDATFLIYLVGLNAPSGAYYSFSDVAVLNSHVLIVRDTTLVSAQKLGTLTSLASFVFNDVAAIDLEDGLTIAGTGWNVWRTDNFGMTTTSATFIGIDMGVATCGVVSFSGSLFDGPIGAISYKGAASSANITTGNLGKITNSNFKSGITALSGLSVDDTRWLFMLNDMLQDTNPDALLSFNGNATETVISVANTPVIVNATWVCIRQSIFDCTAGGRATSLSERDITSPTDITVGLISAGGGAIDVTVYLAIDGSVVTDSATTVAISGSSQEFISIPWQEILSQNQFVEVWLENNTNTTNVIVESGKLRVR